MHDILARLEQRLGTVHARQRLGIEDDHEADCLGQGLNFFQVENWYSVHAVIRSACGSRASTAAARRNVGRVQVRRNTVVSPRLPQPSTASPSCSSAICTPT